MAYILDTRVVGVTFANDGSNRENRQDIIADLLSKGLLESGQNLRLQRDPENPYDHNAVSVIGPDGRQIGNLSKENAVLISSKLAMGTKYIVKVQNVSGGNGYSYGVNIRIEEIEATQTVLNQNLEESSLTTINQESQNTSLSSGTGTNNPAVTSINNSLHESHISPGTLLCEVYEVEQKMDIVTGEADLYICQFAARKYVAKVYRRKIAIKPEVSERVAQIKSPFVARVFALGEYNGYPVEILPYYMHGSLSGKQYSFEKLKYEIIPSINEGLHVLHENGIIHKDVKPSNIMLNNDGRTAAIIDFGISSIRENGSTVVVTKTGLTPEYSAPETFRNLFLNESDYYSLGVSIFELYCGHTPYSNMSQEEIEQFISIQKLPLPQNMEKELKDLIDALTYPDITNRRDKSNPNRRWGYEEIINWCNDIPQPLPGAVVKSAIPMATPSNLINLNSQSFAQNQVQTTGDMLPYRFAGSLITETSDLAKKLNEHWDDGKKHLFRGLLLSHFKKDSNADIISKLMDYEEEVETTDPDILLFNCIYTINPNLKYLVWKGHEWADLSAFGTEVLNAVRDNNSSLIQLIDEIISKGVLSQYIICTDPQATAQLDVLKSIESKFRVFPKDNREQVIRYYRIGYILSDEITFNSNGEKFHSYDELVGYFRKLNLSSNEEYEKKCKSLLCINENEIDPQYLCWIDAVGLGEKLETSNVSEIILFNSYYSINPELNALIWNGKSFDDLHEFGYSYLEAIRSNDAVFVEFADSLLAKGLVRRYCIIKNEVDASIMQEIQYFESNYAAYIDNDSSLQKLRYHIAYKLSSNRDFMICGHYFNNLEELASYLHTIFSEDPTQFDQICSLLIPSSGKLDHQLECWFIETNLQSAITQWYAGIDLLKDKLPQNKDAENIPEKKSLLINEDLVINDTSQQIIYDASDIINNSLLPSQISLETFLNAIRENNANRNTEYRIISFGSYPYGTSENDNKSIEWIVLCEIDNYALLLSKYAIDQKTYNRQNDYISWENCDLRRWLNNRFISDAHIDVESLVPISYDGEQDKDSVFLFNFDELDLFNGANILQAWATDFATNRGVKSARDTGFCPYWTRTTEDEMAYVITGGGHNKRKLMTAEFVGVRPAIVVDLRKINTEQ